MPRRRANSSDDALASHLSEWSPSASDAEWGAFASERAEAHALARPVQHPWANLGPGDDHASAPPVIGPFRVVGHLGRGGMGVVYRAVHLETGEHVAVKMVRSVDPRRIERLRREISALARLRHPLIVRIIHAGDSDLGPWYAMPLLTGSTLIEHCAREPETIQEVDLEATLPTEAYEDALEQPSDEWWTGSLTPRRSSSNDLGPSRLDMGAVEALRIVRLLCSPLAYLHGEGLVHRDLKPDNILVNADGVPVVVDFGLSGEFGGAVSRERLERRMGVVGTPAYMSPEQIRGDLVDARSDMYSVGCILYELLTGRPPFVADTIDEVFRRHLEEPPDPPSLVRGAALPLEVDELVLALLEKDPLRRLWHADDLSARLDAILDLEGALRTAPDPRLPQPRPYLYRPVFVGRTPEVRVVGEVLDGLRDGRGGVVLVGGAAGTGKTRLGLEVVKRLGQLGTLVLVSEGDSSTAGRPLGAMEPIFGSLSDFCRAGGPGVTDEILGGDKAWLTQFSPSLTTLPGAHNNPAKASYLPAGVARARTVAQLWQLVATVVAKGPVALVFDDLHKADSVTFEFLVSVAGGDLAGNVPLLILGTYRPEEAPEDLGRLLRIPRVRHVPLNPLDDAQVGVMVGHMLGQAVPPQTLVRFLTERAGGNPFAVAEYLRTALESGLLARDAGGRWVLTDRDGSSTLSRLGLPNSLGELIRGRLRTLPAPLQELMAVAWVADGVLDAGMAADVVRRNVDEVREQLGLLVLRELVAGEGHRFDLAHDQVRRAVADAVDPRAIADLRARIRDAWMARRAAGIEVPLDRLADVLRHLGQSADASEVYLDAARHACSLGALEVAGRCYQAHLELSPDQGLPRLVATREWVEGVLLAQGPTAALRVLDVAVQRASALGADAELARIQLLRGRAFLADGKPDAAVEALEDAIEHGMGRVRDAVVTEARCALADALRTLDRLEEASAVADAAVQGSVAIGGPAHGAALGAQAGVLAAQGAAARAHELYDEALALHVAVGDREAQAKVLVAIAALDTRAGQYAAAGARLERSRALAADSGDLRMTGWVLERLGWLALHRGDAAAATSLYGDAVDALRASGSTRTLMGARAELARAHAWRGELRLAQELLNAALASASTDVGLPGAIVRLRLADVASLRGELAEAQTQLRAARVGAPPRLAFDIEVVAVRLRRISEGATFAVGPAQQLIAAARDADNPLVLVSAIAEALPALRDVGRYEEARDLAIEGVELSGALGHAFGEVTILREAVTMARYSGDLDGLEQLLAQAGQRASHIGDAVALAHLACERAHLHLAVGHAVAGTLGDAQVRTERLAVTDNSETARRLVAVVRAVTHRGAGGELVHGARLEDYPPAVRRALEAQRT